MRYLFLLILTCAIALVPAYCADAKKPVLPALPTYRCKHIDKEITLTGKLDDPLWKNAEAFELVDSETGHHKGYHTVARLLWSQKYLYVGMQCEDEYVWGTFTKRDDPIFNEEAVEIFVSPTGFIRQYYEIEVSPRNTVLDTFVLNGKSENNYRWDNYHTFFDYDIEGLLTQVSIDGELNKPHGAKSWTVEMAIPFTGLIGPNTEAPLPGNQWRMNLFRIDSPDKKLVNFYAWSPIMIYGDFHRPWHFGFLEFIK